MALQPKHDEYKCTKTRLDSFNNRWSSTVKLPPELAQAGFICLGSNDRVICFFCGVCLYSWEKSDNVWIEHARWSNQCYFLRFCMGEEFIRKVGSGEITETNCTIDEMEEDLFVKFDRDEYILNTPAAEACLFMDMPERDVLLAARSYILDHRKSDFRATDLLQITQQKKMNKPSTTIIQSSCEQLHETNVKFTDAATVTEPCTEEFSLKTICKICFAREINCSMSPCGHTFSCLVCAQRLTVCSLCSQHIEKILKIYIS